MDNNFLNYWFKGFNDSLDNIGELDRNEILKQCGRACSDSYTKNIYLNEYKNSTDFTEFLLRLKNKFPEIDFEFNREKKIIILKYNYCACDLVKNGYIKNVYFCECSRQSLLYNWGSVFGENNVSVKIIKSILGGHDCCKFEINVENIEGDDL